MYFASDNAAGVSEPILAAIAAANAGAVPSYGADPLTAKVEARLAEIFEADVSVFLVGTGTAANALSLAALTPAWGAVLCHRSAHIMTDECGAPEFFSGGAKLIGLSGQGAKIDAGELAATLDEWPFGVQHYVQPSVVSISQATELGGVYTPDDISAIAGIARARGLGLHMDGARFANALVSHGVSPADLTWRAGVDILSFGATKNGAMGAEAVVVFSKPHGEAMAFRRKRGGHLISKSRFVAAQLLAYLDDDHWLDLARHANAMAAELGRAVVAAPGADLAAPVEANEVFAWLDQSVDRRLRDAGARYYPWSAEGASAGAEGRVLVRLVASFRTTSDEVRRFSDLLGDI